MSVVASETTKPGVSRSAVDYARDSQNSAPQHKTNHSIRLGEAGSETSE